MHPKKEGENFEKALLKSLQKGADPRRTGEETKTGISPWRSAEGNKECRPLGFSLFLLATPLVAPAPATIG